MSPTPLSEILARKLPAEDEERHEEEVALLLAIFYRFVQALVDEEGEWDSLAELMEARADHLIRHAITGYGLTFEEAIELIKNTKNLTSEQINQRDTIIAAVDNLADFAVAEEYQMADEIAEMEERLDEDDLDEMDFEDWFEFYLPVFEKFNDRYARTENNDVEYAMIVAAFLSVFGQETILMYMTMGDERVRPWHLQYEGFTAPKSRFPAWLIPPIEHGCRCFLVEDTASVAGNVEAALVSEPKMPEWFNRTFKESVALGGRIFSDEHPYFQVDERHMGRLNAISQRIKDKYLK